MTLPILNHLNKPTQVALKADSDIKVDGKQQYAGFITVAIDIELDGKKYTVRRYFVEDSLKGMSHDQITKDKQVRVQVMEMVEKMVNIAIAYNLGREKQKGKIEEISLLRDQHTISRKIGNAQQEKDLEKVVPDKFRKYTRLKVGNEKKYEALQYLYGKYGSNPKATTPSISFVADKPEGHVDDALSDYEEDGEDRLRDSEEEEEQSQPNPQKGNLTPPPSPNPASSSSSKPSAQTALSNIDKPLIPTSQLPLKPDERSIPLVDAKDTHATQETQKDKIDAPSTPNPLASTQLKPAAQVLPNPTMQPSSPLPPSAEKSETKSESANPLKKTSQEHPDQTTGPSAEPGKKDTAKISSAPTSNAHQEILNKLHQDGLIISGLVEAAKALPYISDHDVENYQKRVEDFNSYLSGLLKRYPDNTSDPEINAIKDKIKELQEEFKNSDLRKKARNNDKAALIPKENESNDVSKAEPIKTIKGKTLDDEAILRSEHKKIKTIDAQFAELLDSLIHKKTFTPEDEKNYQDLKQIHKEALALAKSKIPSKTNDPESNKLIDEILSHASAFDKTEHLPLKDMVTLNRLAREQIELKAELRKIERDTPQTNQENTILNERKGNLIKEIKKKKEAMRAIVQPKPPLQTTPPIGTITEHIEEKSDSELERKYIELNKQAELLAKLFHHVIETKIVSDEAEEEYKTEHETFRELLNDFENAIPNDHPSVKELKEDVHKLRSGFSYPSLQDFINSFSESLMETKQKELRAKIIDWTALMKSINPNQITDSDEENYKQIKIGLFKALDELEKSIPMDQDGRIPLIESIKEMRTIYRHPTLRDFHGTEFSPPPRADKENLGPESDEEDQLLQEAATSSPAAQNSPALALSPRDFKTNTPLNAEEMIRASIKTFSKALDDLGSLLNEVITDKNILDEPARLNELNETFNEISNRQKIIQQSYGDLAKLEDQSEANKEAIGIVRKFYSNLDKSLKAPFLDLLKTNKQELKDALAESHKELLKLNELAKNTQGNNSLL